MCVYCECGRNIREEIVEFTSSLPKLEVFPKTAKESLDQLLSTSNDGFDLNAYSAFYKSQMISPNVELKRVLEEKRIFYKLKQIKNVDFHKSIAKRQREIYNKYRQDPEFLGDDAILIDVDWKEKICYGKNSPRQLNPDWFECGSCSLLGFGIYYVDKKIDEASGEEVRFVNCLNIDILNDDKTQTAASYIQAFRFLRTIDRFREIERKRKKYIIFTDTARQFRCEELNYFYLHELKQDDVMVSFNYFCECHGKVNFILV